MEAFAEEKEDWLRGFPNLANGIPSHDTLSDVLGRIDPTAFASAFTAWVTAAAGETPLLLSEFAILLSEFATDRKEQDHEG